MAEIPERAIRLLEGRHLASLATVMPDGSPQVTPIWIDYDGNSIIVNTVEGRIKDRNVRRDPRVAISIHDAERPYEPLIVRGRVTEITNKGAEEHINVLSRRYMDEDPYPHGGIDDQRVILRIRPEKVSFGLD